MHGDLRMTMLSHGLWSFLADGLDKPVGSIGGKHMAQRGNRLPNRIVRDDAAFPYLLYQLVVAVYLVRMIKEILQQIRDAGLEFAVRGLIE